MSGLDNFYTSNEWRTLLAIIKSERVNEKGELICEHCHEPIIKTYDCIGHHEIALDEQNVNDYNISLNPDNIRLVHHRCHNKIHNKLGYLNRNVYLVYGSPLSGKTTFVHENMSEGDLIVDIDNIWECVSGCDRYVKPNRLKQNVFDIRNLLIDSIRMRKGKWSNAWLIGGYPLISERERLRRSLGAKEIFIDTSKEECIKRLYKSDRSIDEWLKYIEDWWNVYSPPGLS